MRTILEPDILDIIESHVRPHCLSLIQHEAHALRATCMEELRQKLEFSEFFVNNDTMAMYRRLTTTNMLDW